MMDAAVDFSNNQTASIRIICFLFKKNLNTPTALIRICFLFFFQFQSSDRRGSGSYFMGNGGISGPASPTSAGGPPPFCRSAMDEDPDAGPASKNNSSRICDHCSSKFNLFNRKVRSVFFCYLMTFSLTRCWQELLF
jgi:hypothetical protein